MAITEVYVDPAIDADSGTGTIGDPFGDLQFALNTVTRDATNGDRFNIKEGTAEVLTAGLSLATYGTPTVAAPIVFQGYTSAAGDGGIGEIDGAATYAVFTNDNASGHPMYFKDLKMGNCGANIVIVNYYASNALSRTYLINCEIHTSSNATALVYSGSYTWAIGSYFHTFSGQNALYSTSGDGWAGEYRVIGNHINTACTAQAISLIGTIGIVKDNLIRLSVAGAKALDVTQQSHTFVNNTVHNTAAGTVTLIPPLTGLVYNNIFSGASGTGGIGMTVSTASGPFGNNAFYNCTTNISGTAYENVRFADDISLGSSPFANAAGGDFEIDWYSDASEVAWPHAFKGLETTVTAADIGAVQSGAGSGGGVSIYTRTVRVIKG